MFIELSTLHTSETDFLFKKIAVAEAYVFVANQRLNMCRGELLASSSKVAAQGTVIDQRRILTRFMARFLALMQRKDFSVQK
jgi:hypothetical protein